MPTVNNRDNIFIRTAKGYGMQSTYLASTSGATTAAAAGSGFLTTQLQVNSIGTTLPNTLVGFQLPAGLTTALRPWLTTLTATVLRGFYLCYFYNMGTVDLANAAAVPYDGFTADASVTYPLTRTKYGQAAQTISLLPFFYITTATTVTAPIFNLATTLGGAGYVDQDGNSIVGTKTMTMPAAATAVQSGFIIRLEEGDSAVQSISAVQVTTKGSAGAARVFGVELLAPLSSLLISMPFVNDGAFSGLNLPDLRPATPTAGTLTSYLGLISASGTGASTVTLHMLTVLD